MPQPDRERLAAGIARGLKAATSSERVAFVIVIDDRGDVPMFSPIERQTRGVAFVDQEGRFNVAFDLIDDRIDPDDLERDVGALITGSGR